VIASDREGASRTVLPPHPLSAGRARRLVGRTLSRSGHGDLADVAELLVSELVTNVVLHACTELMLTVRADGTTVRVEVSDRSRVPAIARSYSVESMTGRGLQLVDGFASRWGSTEDAKGKTVWFELDRGEE
jgi:anti-sigma regulatory factor (Ser/Thr protein kinase)